MPIEKRYQVFVSSTYEDLLEERQEVMQALLEEDCIPSGMELFPAASEDQWTLIKRVIDDCDYYVVIIGGRYGSVGTDGTSYTEMEYRYARERGKPVIGFIHKDPGRLAANRCESDPAMKSKLVEFCSLVERKMCRYWESPADRGSQVSRSLVKLIKAHPAVGWVRADQVPDEAATEEILRLRRHLDEVEHRLQAARTTAPEGAQDHAQGFDTFEVAFRFHAGGYGNVLDQEMSTKAPTTWNAIFGAVAPLMINEASDKQLKAD
jgi:Domain of unknown function (DUF4062)